MFKNFRKWRTIALATVACCLLLAAAVYSFGADPKELLKFLGYSVLLLLVVMAVALLASLFWAGLKKLVNRIKG